MIDIKQAVKQDVTFSYYRDGLAYYKTCYGEEFPVPLDDVGNATLLARDKGIYFMRYMRKWNKTLEQV